MKIINAQIIGIKLPYKTSFKVSKHTFYDYYGYIVRLTNEDGTTGVGECVQLETPWYSDETFATARIVLEDYIIPSILNIQCDNEIELLSKLEWIQGQYQAKAGIETAICDIASKLKGMPLYKYLGGENTKVKTGVSIGIQEESKLLNTVGQYLQQGYERIKVKIAPGNDVDVIESILNKYPDISLMVDCNAAYTKKDFDLLKQLDNYNLLMLEQPLGNGDLLEHAQLQSLIKTPICLDESVHNMADATLAKQLNACKIINVKPPRVGGPLHVAQMVKMLGGAGIGAWVGGMMETGIGRMMNIACATLGGITHPGDIRPPLDYLVDDIVTNKFEVINTILIPSSQSGLGVIIDEEKLEKATVYKKMF